MATTLAIQTHLMCLRTDSYLIVQKGRELPRIITDDLSLTSDDLWILSDQTLIEAGVTVTVTEGTQIQFWTAESSSPYPEDSVALVQVEGTLLTQGQEDNPVELFPAQYQYPMAVKIETKNDGVASLDYSRIMNPLLVVTDITHSYLTQDGNPLYYRIPGDDRLKVSDPLVHADVQTSIIHRLVELGIVFSKSYGWGRFRTCLFDTDGLSFRGTGHSNVFLHTYDGLPSTIAFGAVNRINFKNSLHSAFPVEYNGQTYALLQNSFGSQSESQHVLLAEEFAQRLNGHVIAINDAAENSLLVRSYLNTYWPNSTQFLQTYHDMDCDMADNCWDLFKSAYVASIGLVNPNRTGEFEWRDYDPVTYQNWGSDYQVDHTNTYFKRSDGYWESTPSVGNAVILELPSMVTDINLQNTRDEMLAVGSKFFFDREDYFESNAILNAWWEPNLTENLIRCRDESAPRVPSLYPK